MRYWYDLSYEEIAAATATTVSAVKSRLHRARCTLASVVNPSENVPPGMTRSPRRPALARSCPAI
jgi:RNA polymerase sigma-70 factor (ECF subfamily)